MSLEAKYPSPVQTARSSMTGHSEGLRTETATIVESLPEAEKSDRIKASGGSDVLEEAQVDEKPIAVDWDGPEDPANPKNWSDAYKWFVSGLCMVMTFNVAFASSAPTAATVAIIRHFHVSQEVSSLITTTFLLGFVFGPLLWGPGSEVLGRRPVLVATLSLYTIFHLGQALAKNIETLLITRFLAGLFAVAPMTICGGILADIWNVERRGIATSGFSASIFLGPALGPLIGGFVNSSLEWYWIFWVLMILAGTCTIIVTVFLPETYAPILLFKKAQRMRKTDPIENKHIRSEHENGDWSFKGLVHRTIFRPFIMLSMEPILALVTVYISIVYGVLYGTFQSLPIIFTQTHGFTLTQNGLIFIGVGIGSTLGAVVNYISIRHYPSLISKWRGFPPPEQRLFGAMIGSPTLVLAAFWIGWTGQYSSIPWYVPAIGTVFLGVGISTIFMSFMSYLVDTYLMYSASAFAANTFVRSIVGGAFPLFTVQMYEKLGINWATTVWGLVGLVFAPSPFLFYKYGARIRSHSTFAPCLDLKITAELEKEDKASLVTV